MYIRDKDGTLKEVLLQPVSDTLPIGSIVKYEGDTVPVGWEEVEGEVINNISESDPVGTIKLFAGSSIPEGWMVCNGSLLNRQQYSELFRVIGTAYGEGDGLNTFAIPNMKGKVPVGLDSTDTDLNTLGKTFGAKTHTLTVAQMPSHNHRAKYTVFVNSGKEIDGVATGVSFSPEGFGRTGDILNNAGGGQAHNNMQPSIALHYIIKILSTTSTIAEIIDNIFGNSITNGVSQNSINNLHTYSTNECRIGTWIDGKPLYRRVYTLDNLPNSNTITFPTGLDYSNVEVVKLYGSAWGVGVCLPLPYVSGISQDQVNLAFGRGDIRIITYNDRSNFKGIFIIEYIKMID